MSKKHIEERSKSGVADGKDSNLEGTLTSFQISNQKTYPFSFILLSNFTIFRFERISNFTAEVQEQHSLPISKYTIRR
jgi:hypothetical protein